MATRSTSILMDEMEMDERRRCTILNAALHTCPETLGTVYVANYRHVLRICRRFFRQREDAEDAAAEVFLKLHRVLEKRDRAVPFKPWVSQVAGRHCIDTLRLGKREKNSCMVGADLGGVPDDSTPSPLALVLQMEEHRQVREQLLRLPERYKVALVLRYYKHLSYTEIARVLNRQLPAVKTMLFRAKDQLRRNLVRCKSRQTKASKAKPEQSVGRSEQPGVGSEYANPMLTV